MTELSEIQDFLKSLLTKQGEKLRITADNEAKFEATGTIPTMQGKQKVDGFYFASVVPKPKDIRFYFFPAYTHREALEPFLTAPIKKALKGKSCMHIKKIDETMQADLETLVDKAVALYQDDGLVAK